MSNSSIDPEAKIIIMAAVAPKNGSGIHNKKIEGSNPADFKERWTDWATLQKLVIITTGAKLQRKEGYESRLCEHLERSAINSLGHRACWTGECYMLFYDETFIELKGAFSVMPWHGDGDATKQAELDKLEMGQCVDKGGKLYFLGEEPVIWLGPQMYKDHTNEAPPEQSSKDGYWVDRRGW
ncbi:hypothetical protein J4E89_003099 [Alternaria sp. Ai002NY15]|nr:hypothetical protein J4E89_003099 [Alternaria sp. Ai002NY15]